jgi:hypothetical protein
LVVPKSWRHVYGDIAPKSDIVVSLGAAKWSDAGRSINRLAVPGFAAEASDLLITFCDDANQSCFHYVVAIGG